MESYIEIKKNKLLITMRMKLKILSLSEEARQKRVHTTWFHLYEIQQQKKLIYGDKHQKSSFALCVRDWLEMGIMYNFVGSP